MVWYTFYSVHFFISVLYCIWLGLGWCVFLTLFFFNQMFWYAYCFFNQVFQHLEMNWPDRGHQTGDRRSRRTARSRPGPPDRTGGPPEPPDHPEPPDRPEPPRTARSRRTTRSRRTGDQEGSGGSAATPLLLVKTCKKNDMRFFQTTTKNFILWWPCTSRHRTSSVLGTDGWPCLPWSSLLMLPSPAIDTTCKQQQSI